MVINAQRYRLLKTACEEGTEKELARNGPWECVIKIDKTVSSECSYCRLALLEVVVGRRRIIISFSTAFISIRGGFVKCVWLEAKRIIIISSFSLTDLQTIERNVVDHTANQRHRDVTIQTDFGALWDRT